MFDLNNKKTVETFKCQNCKEYTTLNNGNCKHCNKPIDIKYSKQVEKQQEIDLKQNLSRKNKNKMVSGLITFIFGTSATILSLSVLEVKGGIAVIFWGAILFGAGAFIDGLVGWIQNKT